MASAKADDADAARSERVDDAWPAMAVGVMAELVRQGCAQVYTVRVSESGSS